MDEWSFESLKAYVDQRFADSNQATKDALAAANRAVEKEEVNSEKWRQNANEWRGAMTDRESKFVTRVELIAAVMLLCALIGAVAAVVTIFFAIRK